MIEQRRGLYESLADYVRCTELFGEVIFPWWHRLRETGAHSKVSDLLRGSQQNLLRITDPIKEQDSGPEEGGEIYFSIGFFPQNNVLGSAVLLLERVRGERSTTVPISVARPDVSWPLGVSEYFEPFAQQLQSGRVGEIIEGFLQAGR